MQSREAEASAPYFLIWRIPKIKPSRFDSYSLRSVHSVKNLILLSVNADFIHLEIYISWSKSCFQNLGLMVSGLTLAVSKARSIWAQYPILPGLDTWKSLQAFIITWLSSSQDFFSDLSQARSQSKLNARNEPTLCYRFSQKPGKSRSNKVSPLALTT